MKKQKFKTNFPNVRYYENSTRKMRNGQADKYYSIGHRYRGRTIEEGLAGQVEAGALKKPTLSLHNFKKIKGRALERKALPKCVKPSLRARKRKASCRDIASKYLIFYGAKPLEWHTNFSLPFMPITFVLKDISKNFTP